jgi:CRP-like cAMP-binding protein
MTPDFSGTPSLVRDGRDRPDGAVHLARGLTRSEGAQLVDAGVETVGRVLAQFVERGWIITGEEAVDVLDAVALRRGALIGRAAPPAAAGRGPQ